MNKSPGLCRGMLLLNRNDGPRDRLSKYQAILASSVLSLPMILFSSLEM